MARLEKDDEVVIIEDIRVVLGGSDAVVGALGGCIGRIESEWGSIPGWSHPGARIFDVRVGKRLFSYRERYLRKPSPLDLLARVAE